MSGPRALILVALSAAIASVVHAQDRPIGFLTPSKNIACQFFSNDGQGVLRCDIMNMETRPRRPADCELDWGHAFEMSAKGAAGRICAEDTVMDASLPVLAYGEVAARGIHVQVGADGADVLQCDAAGIFAGAGEAGGVLTSQNLSAARIASSQGLLAMTVGRQQRFIR